MTHPDDRTPEMHTAWADLPAAEVQSLIDASASMGWRQALDGVADRAPFFAKRMRNLGLLDWNLLLLKDSRGTAVDVGCGFGSGVLGLAEQYSRAIGVEFLPDRVRYASLRAAETQNGNCQILRGTGHHLPLPSNSVSLVTLNGVLEWAGLYEEQLGPTDSQLAMLAEARRVLAPDGTLAVAIENRFAAESLLGLKDTHSQLTMVTALPRFVADVWSRLWKGRPYRTYLYSHSGYRRLFSRTGFAEVRLLDLVSSYNDYDFVVQTNDSYSYKYLWERGCVRSFYEPAGRLREWMSWIRPSWLGKLSYAYLVLAGNDVLTALDAEHPLWGIVSKWDVLPGKARFGCRGPRRGHMTVVAHDGRSVQGVVELNPGGGTPCSAVDLPDRIDVPPVRCVGERTVRGQHIRAHLPR